MIQSIINIFSNQADQARLVTTLIAAIIAVSVVLLNQWLNSKRARKEKIIDKIEEAFTSVVSMQELMNNLHTEIVNNYEKYPKNKKNYSLSLRGGAYKADEYDNAHPIHLEIIRAGEKALMLSMLYFPSLEECIKQIYVKHQESYNGFTSSDKLQDYLAIYKENRIICDAEFAELSNKLTLIMNKHMH